MSGEMATEAREVRLDKAAGAQARCLALWEIASVTTSFLIAEWMIIPLAGNSKLVAAIPVGLAFALMLFSHRTRGESAREVGWRLDNFGQAARLLLLPVLLGVCLIIGAGLWQRSLRFDGRQVMEWALWLPIWGLAQQYVLQGFVNRRAQLAVGPGRKSLLLVAFIFALLHLPNPWLSLVTLVGGYLTAYVYQRAPNLIALAIAHALISMLLALSLPASTLNSLRVGVKYFG
jgi:membrane protease YdiL (CAAX protease family)